MTDTEYMTSEGDRLDLIAYKAYGDPFAWQSILDANPSLPIVAVYPAGIKIIIPVVENTTVTEQDKLAPWKA